MNEENLVSSSTASTSTPFVVNLRDGLSYDENSVNSYDSIEAFLNEPAHTSENAVHTTGAEYEDILGMPLSERLKNMTESQKSEILRHIKETKKWKAKYLRNKQSRDDYSKKISEQMRKVEELRNEIKMLREDIKAKKEEYDTTQKGVEDTEEELLQFQKELRQKIRMNNEVKRLKNEKEKVEREIRIKSRFTRKCQKKLLRKAVIEKEIKSIFQENIDTFQHVTKVLSEKDLIGSSKKEEMDNSAVDWKMQLALYEDSNIDEIKALHDDVDMEDEQKSNEEKDDEQSENSKDDEEEDDDFIEVEMS